MLLFYFNFKEIVGSQILNQTKQDHYGLLKEKRDHYELGTFYPHK